MMLCPGCGYSIALHDGYFVNHVARDIPVPGGTNRICTWSGCTLAGYRPRETCPICGAVDKLLWPIEPTELDDDVGCAECVRSHAQRVNRVQLCDNDPEHGAAWRNPKTRRNEYLCARCHVASGDGVIQNIWSRASKPLGARSRPDCEAKGVLGTKPCDGNVKPRGTSGVLLCNAHAGKQSYRYQ